MGDSLDTGREKEKFCRVSSQLKNEPIGKESRVPSSGRSTATTYLVLSGEKAVASWRIFGVSDFNGRGKASEFLGHFFQGVP